MPITSQEEHYESRKRLNELFKVRNNSPEERDEFDNLLHDITQYELETGMIKDEDFNDLNNK